MLQGFCGMNSFWYCFRVLSIVPQQVKAKVLDAASWFSSQVWFGIAYCGIMDKTVMD